MTYTTPENMVIVQFHTPESCGNNPDCIIYNIILIHCTLVISISSSFLDGAVVSGSGRASALTYCGFSDIWLKLTLPGPSAGVSGSLDSYCSLKPLCSGMGEVVPARTSPTLLPPSPRTVLSLSCFKVLQCITCRDWHCKS